MKPVPKVYQVQWSPRKVRYYSSWDRMIQEIAAKAKARFPRFPEHITVYENPQPVKVQDAINEARGRSLD